MTYDDEYDGCVCDYCGDAVIDADHENCRPDNTGHCILCGEHIGDK